MSRNERDRSKIMAGVAQEDVTLIAASGLMGVSYRQGKRIWRRYQDEGDDGLVHRLRGKPSPRRKSAKLREQVLALFDEPRYEGFGPTLMAEQLLKAKLVVDHETLRRWRIAKGRHTVGRRKQQHRDWRERKACFGEMVQMDGSHHDWFEGRGSKCVLMVMVDDATNRMHCRVFEEETTRASYDVLEEARIAWEFICGSGQHLSVRRTAEHRGTTGGESTTNAVWRGDGAVGDQADIGQQPASQRASGMDERHTTRPAGQRDAAGWDQ